ncbi:CRIB domain-containing protein RIC5 [Euphorbia peplus]|nr:CRIB domain-containing protein RIC5 [Euphorbia peplus]
MSNNKMKGLLKGLRYISQIFDNEKEPEMQIGFPTDVKHVAHIGWDGPAVNSPSWMGDFKAASSSAPLNSKGEPEDLDDTASWASEDIDSTKRISKSSRLDGESSEKPRSRRGSSSGGLGIEESVLKEKPEKSEKPKQRRSSKTKDSSDGKSSRQKDSTTDSTPANLPKKSRRKKSKDISSSKASRSKSQAVDGDCGSDSGSVSRSVHNDNSECGSNVSANLSALEDETENGLNGVC